MAFTQEEEDGLRLLLAQVQAEQRLQLEREKVQPTLASLNTAAMNARTAVKEHFRTP